MKRGIVFDGWMVEQYRTTRRIARETPYFARTEELRSAAAEVLKETGGLTIGELRKNLKRFNVPTTTCLAAVLCKDTRKRFKSENKIWHIVQGSGEHLLTVPIWQGGV